jgi:L-threonylcarbamoyladenylate synthase
VLNFRIQTLSGFISGERVVACPAESVWGLSCDPFSASAVETLLAMKSRPVDKGLIVVAADSRMLGPVFSELSEGERKEVEMSWPGNNTWLLPNRQHFPPWITGDSSHVAVRVTSAPALRDLSLAVSGPLVSTSANPAGGIPARHGFQVVKYFGAGLPRGVGTVDLEGRPSTIRKIGSGEIIRA